MPSIAGQPTLRRRACAQACPTTSASSRAGSDIAAGAGGAEDVPPPPPAFQLEGAGNLLDSYPNLGRLPRLETSEAEVPRLSDDVLTGQLKNGLTYFVKPNSEPKQRAELWLVVGFGSLVEEDNVRGGAHIIEHLGFSATKNYENHKIIKFLESIGAPFGACQNAYTSTDETVYTLHVSSDREALVDESLAVLREFAYFTRISEEDLDKERKVVLEEWRATRTAQGRMSESYFKALTRGCKYCDRLPIGTEERILNMPAALLRDFYQRYYHPARMAVIAVGDFPYADGAAAVVEKIRELFDIPPEEISPLPRAPVPPDRPHTPVPDTEGVQVCRSADPELSVGTAILDCKRQRPPRGQLADVRRGIVESLFHKALSSRLLRLIMTPPQNGPRNLISASSSGEEPVPGLSTLSLSVVPYPGRMLPAMRDLLQEVERVRRFGFRPAELRRAKLAMLADSEQRYIEREQQPSSDFAEELVALFLKGMPAPGVVFEASAEATLIPEVQDSEVQEVAAGYDWTRNVVCKLATPPLSICNPLWTAWSMWLACSGCTLPGSGNLPGERKVTSLLEKVGDWPLEPWPEDIDAVESRLVNSQKECAERRLPLDAALFKESRKVSAPGVPRPAREQPHESPASVSEATAAPLRAELGADELGEEVTLGNGLRIVLIDSDLFEDEVLLRGCRWGGLSELRSASGEVRCEAASASMVAMMLGICGLKVEELQEVLDGVRVNAEPPEIGDFKTNISASSSPADLETLLLLMHLAFMRPVEAAGKANTSRLSFLRLILLATKLAEYTDPETIFWKRVRAATTADDPFLRPPSLWRLLWMNFAKSSAIFNERVARPEEWTFTLVGRLPPRLELLPLLERYLGTVPNEERPGRLLGDRPVTREAVTRVDVPCVPHTLREKVRISMKEPKGTNVIAFPLQLATAVVDPGPTASAELRERFLLVLVGKMLETRLVEVLRFRRGQVYTVSVGEDFSTHLPRLGERRKGQLQITFECDPEEADDLLDVALAEIEGIRAGDRPFTEKDVVACQEQERRLFEEQVRKNHFWSDTVLELYFSKGYTGDVGETLSRWWRVRQELLEGLTPALVQDGLSWMLPEGGRVAVLSMRPKRSLWSWLLCRRPQPKASPAAAAPA